MIRVLTDLKLYFFSFLKYLLNQLYLHYISNLPEKNLYPEDNDYLKNLEMEVNEVKELFNSVQNNKMVPQKVSMVNRRILNKYYHPLIFGEPELLLKKESKEEMYKRYANYYDQMLKVILIDTSDKAEAKLISEEYEVIARYYRNLKDYNQSILYSVMRKKGIAPFFKKYQNDDSLRKEISNIEWNLSWDYLFVKKFDSAVASASRGLKYYPENDGIITNLVLGCLLGKKYERPTVYTKSIDIAYIQINQNVLRRLFYKISLI